MSQSHKHTGSCHFIGWQTQAVVVIMTPVKESKRTPGSRDSNNKFTIQEGLKDQRGKRHTL